MIATYRKLPAVALLSALLMSCSTVPNTEIETETEQKPQQSKPLNHLSQFASKDAFDAFFKAQKEKQRQQRAKYNNVLSAPPMVAESVSEAKSEAESGSSDDNITNNQYAGVDEGGIVKKVGNTLVVLRRGRLFTINIANGKLKKADLVNAYGQGINPQGTWYDEMLIKGNTVIVIGYSYHRGGTEIGLFELDKQGRLSHRNSYNIRSSDYYSAENYASRLVDNQLVFYTPLHMNYHKDVEESLPAIRQWQVGKTKKSDKFTPTIQQRAIYDLTDRDSDSERLYQTLHTVTRCGITDFELDCHSTSVIGDYGRVFYVSPTAVYAWIQRRTSDKDAPSGYILQMPLDGTAPSSMQVKGAPFDQLSFLEKNNQLYVLLQEHGYGEGMWAKHFGSGKMSLLSVPISSFGSASAQASLNQYHPVPRPNNSHYINNRYVGDYLMYGEGNGWYDPKQSNASSVYAVSLDAFNVNEVKVNHVAERIERLGNNALVVGSTGKALGMTSIQLTNTDQPKTVSTYQFAGANQSESRTHGFFYKPRSKTTGWLGLPIINQNRGATHQLKKGAAAVTFLKNDDLKLSPIGQLGSGTEGQVNDDCKASCVDWYGNARPIFVGDRVFALMGYELVEGKVTLQKNGAQITEVARLDMLSAPVS